MNDIVSFSWLLCSGNLYKPLPEQASISGGWLEKERKGKQKTLRKTAGKVAIAAAAIAGTGWLLTQKKGSVSDILPA